MFVIRKILKLNLRLFIMYKLKELFLMFILALFSLAAYAQSLTVTGKVIDSEGYEVIGSSVTIKGVAGVGTVTDVNGNYTLKVNDASKDVLVFSYVGMTPQEVKVNNRSVINVTLQLMPYYWKTLW